MATDRLDAQTILVVEDEPFILLEIRRTLEEVGARVLAARSAQEAQLSWSRSASVPLKKTNQLAAFPRPAPLASLNLGRRAARP
jgi:CheY-like chemotaxis protein